MFLFAGIGTFALLSPHRRASTLEKEICLEFISRFLHRLFVDFLIHSRPLSSCMYQKHMIEKSLFGSYGVTGGTRIHDNLSHNQVLYQLSYSHMELVDGFEPPDLLLTRQPLYLLSYTSILNFKGRWRWGLTDSYSRRFQTANPYFSDFTPAGTESCNSVQSFLSRQQDQMLFTSAISLYNRIC